MSHILSKKFPTQCLFIGHLNHKIVYKTTCRTPSANPRKLWANPHKLDPKLFLVDVLWVQIVFSWLFRGFYIFSHRFLVGPNVFLVGVLWVQNFSHGYFVSPKFFLVCILWLISWYKDFQMLAAWKWVIENRDTQIHVKPCILFQINLKIF